MKVTLSNQITSIIDKHIEKVKQDIVTDIIKLFDETVNHTTFSKNIENTITNDLLFTGNDVHLNNAVDMIFMNDFNFHDPIKVISGNSGNYNNNDDNDDKDDDNDNKDNNNNNDNDDNDDDDNDNNDNNDDNEEETIPLLDYTSEDGTQYYVTSDDDRLLYTKLQNGDVGEHIGCL